MEKNNNAKTALILAIVASATVELVFIVPSFVTLFGFYNTFSVFLAALLVAGGPITMGATALNLIKTAYKPRRYQVILVKIFSIVAISTSALFLLIVFMEFGLIGLLINFAM